MEFITEYTKLECRRIEEDDTIRSSLESLILARLNEANTAAQERLTSLLKDEQGDVLQTVNHYFAETLDKIRKDRLLARLQGVRLQDEWVGAKDAGQPTEILHISNEDQTVIDLHDVLKTFYKVSMKRFADYVVIKVVERVLGERDAVKFFCQNMLVACLTRNWRTLPQKATRHRPSGSISSNVVSGIAKHLRRPRVFEEMQAACSLG